MSGDLCLKCRTKCCQEYTSTNNFTYLSEIVMAKSEIGGYFYTFTVLPSMVTKPW